MDNMIRVVGAAEHNLQQIDVCLPRNQLSVITGVSGSGKSSLAFDTLFAEGQRRYVESLSAYARQFIDQLQKPAVVRIDGLSPAIAIEQRNSGANPRSTVATATEIHDYLRLLFANAGQPHCPHCGKALVRMSAESIVDQLMGLPEGTRLMLLAPCSVADGAFVENIRRRGYVRVRVDGAVMELETVTQALAKRARKVEMVIDRVVVKTGEGEARLTDSVELCLRVGDGVMFALNQFPGQQTWAELRFSEDLCCDACDVRFGALTPRHFSFNSPQGACPVCDGLGTESMFDERLLVPDNTVPLEKGAIPAWRSGGRALILYYRRLLKGFSEHFGITLSATVADLTSEMRRVLFYGSGDVEMSFSKRKGGGPRKVMAPFEGVIPNLQRRLRETDSESVRQRLRRYMTRRPCPACGGHRLRPESAACTFKGVSIVSLLAMTIDQAHAFFNDMTLSAQETVVAGELIREIRERLFFLCDVGLTYLTLDRESRTLSGGEAQRLRLATQLGAALTGVLYVLDEPTIGLHERDNERLIAILKRLRDLGNTVVVVEHDEAMIRAADWVIDMGPAAGTAGGRVMYCGEGASLLACDQSPTARFLRQDERRVVPFERRSPSDDVLLIEGASANNLKHIDVTVPLGLLVCVSGVSGSGKSTLVNEVLRKELCRVLSGARDVPGQHRRIQGIEHIDKVVVIDQSPIGRSPRSNPVTYTGAFDPLRKLFAETSSARLRGYGPGRFSFNVKGGRCEACGGGGQVRLEMHFMPDVYVTCERCRGRRYNRETLAITYGGHSIADVLDMTVTEGLEVFRAIPSVARRLQTLHDVGLGYLQLGQSAITLSGGEAQRVKLAAELSRVSTGRTLYLLDEPTTGLHFADVKQLLSVLVRLRDQGNTVLIIEHNLDVIGCADYVIDLGPDGGVDGGQVVATGTPEDVMQVRESYTGRFLAMKRS